MRRTNELDTLLQKLYEDYALGRLSEKRHAKLSAQYEAEQAQLEQRSAELMEQMNAEQEESINVDRFMELVERYTDFTELTTPMLNEFIDKVIVYERRKPPKRFTLPAIPALHPSGTTSPRRAKKQLRCRSPRWRN